MLSHINQVVSRRHLPKFLAASPLLTCSGVSALAQGSPSRPADPLAWAPRDLDKLIDNAGHALDVFDFEPVMKKNVPAAHFGYMASGVDDEMTLRANREAFQKLQLRPRRLVDVSKIDMRTDILGTTYDSPIVICPTASNKAFHPDGEVAVARAARAGNHLQMLSTVATTSIEDAIAARGAPVWFQLYPTRKWEVAEALAKRAERAGSPVIVVTVDVLAPQNWETLFRLRRLDDRQCGTCHGRTMQDYVARKPNFDGIDLAGVNFNATNLTWGFVKRLRDTVRAKIMLKGILTGEDATLAVDNGVDGIIVSNHGGRVDDSGRATIDALPEIIAAVGGRMPVLVDSGFRRGTDIVKALAIGAQAVCIGRPYLWGLGAFGQTGVERVLEILRTETHAVMQQIGAPSIKDLTPDMVRRDG
ncbi:MAG TPA: alpha-hydroxy acid oxidase [Acetobacteraceae bacterium]|nr:alpha-hydroxy acid oxidase [Acetobacteraceae bacterium]